jgi:hypothetical protein
MQARGSQGKCDEPGTNVPHAFVSHELIQLLIGCGLIAVRFALLRKRGTSETLTFQVAAEPDRSGMRAVDANQLAARKYHSWGVIRARRSPRDHRTRVGGS